MMKIAFYKAPGTLIDKGIRWYDWGEYSHVELIFSDGLCFSSSPRSKSKRTLKPVKGTRLLDIVDIETSGNWDIEYLPQITEEMESVIRKWAEKEALENKGYDFGGVFHFFAPFVRNRQDKWFCSEVCLKALQQVGLFLDYNPGDVTPDGLYNIVNGQKPRYVPWVKIFRSLLRVGELVWPLIKARLAYG